MRYLVNKPRQLEVRLHGDGSLEVYDFQKHKLLNHIYTFQDVSFTPSLWLWGVRKIKQASVPNDRFRYFRIDLGPIHINIERTRQLARPDDFPEKPID